VTAASLSLSGTIANGGDAATLTIKQASTTYTNGIYLERASERNGYYMYIGGALDALTFRRNYFGTQSDVMSLTRDGNVGIGTDSPTFYGSSYRTLEFNAPSFPVFNMSSGGIRQFSVVSSTSESLLGTFTSTPLIFYSNSAPRMTITSGGDLLVGTSTTDVNTQGCQLRSFGLGIFVRSGASTLQLNRLTSDGIIASFRTSDIERGSISIAGSVTSYNVTSDYRLKEDFKEINGLEKVNAIKVYDYKWKSDNKRMDGVLAHELAEVLPYAVFGEKDELDEYGNNRMQSVDYSKIVPVMVKAIQELKKEIETLKN
jgi:hypothetical protein